MPLNIEESINEDYILLLWEITESTKELFEIANLKQYDLDKCNNFRSEDRKREFLATRILLHSQLGNNIEIENNSDGKPILKNSDWNISISHTKDIAGIILCKNADIALDIEYISDRVDRIKSRFLSSEELKNISETKKTYHLYQHWCAKECLIKLYGKKDINLIDELKIMPFNVDDKKFKGHYNKNGILKEYVFKHKSFDKYIMVWSYNK